MDFSNCYYSERRQFSAEFSPMMGYGIRKGHEKGSVQSVVRDFMTLKENRVTTDLLQKDYDFSSPRCSNTAKHKNDVILSTLRSYMETHKPRYVNQTGTVKHLNITEKSRFNFEFTPFNKLRSCNGSCIEGESSMLMNKSQENNRIIEYKSSENPDVNKIANRNCFSNHNQKRTEISSTPLNNMDSNNNATVLYAQKYHNSNLESENNKAKEIKSVIKHDDDTFWKIFDKENESLDDREFVKKCSTNRNEMGKDKPKSQYLINKEIMENMTKFRNMLTDNKNVDFGHVRAKYLSKYCIKTNDISRLQTLLFMKQRCSLDKERINCEKEYLIEKQNLIKSLRCLQKETNKRLKSNNLRQLLKQKMISRKFTSSAVSKFRACSSSQIGDISHAVGDKLPSFSKHSTFKPSR